MKLYAKVLKVKSNHFHPLNTVRAHPRHSAIIKATSDTGCQSCLAGMSTLAKLGISTKDLIPVTTQMRSADNDHIELLGAIFIELSGIGEHHVYQSKQMVYISSKTEAFYLNRSACLDLGIISEEFPTVGENGNPIKTAAIGQDPSPVQTEKSTDVIQNELAPCGCPKRTLPSPTQKPPCDFSDKNRKLLEEHLLSEFKSSTFNVCTHQLLPEMHGPPMRLMVDRTARPVAIHKAIPVPLHFQEEVKEGLDSDVRLGVIEPVPEGTPVTWCHRMVICSKKCGRCRRTVDFQALNRHACRETHHTPSPYQLAREVPCNTKKTTFDAWNGYHSIKLHKSDHHFTTFNTPWGRYRYLRCPQGYIASGDAYTRRYDEIIAEVKHKVKCIDDTLMWANNIEESYTQAVKYLDLCGRNGIILNPKKFTFSADEIEFAGFKISKDSIAPIPTFLKAVEGFPRPKTITDIRSWFGLVNQAAYSFSKCSVMEPFRKLMKKGSQFVWNEDLEKAFKAAKVTIKRKIEKGVRIFEKNRKTCLATDWSKTGIGAWLLQKHCKCDSSKPFCCPTGWHVTLFCSRYLTEAESRYSATEGESLAMVFGLEKTKYFVLGCTDLVIAVDHKPLIGLFTKRSLDNIPNARLRNLKEKTLPYRFQMDHVAGVKNRVADCLSRSPSEPAEHMDLIDDMDNTINKIGMVGGGMTDQYRMDMVNISRADGHTLGMVNGGTTEEHRIGMVDIGKAEEHMMGEADGGPMDAHRIGMVDSGNAEEHMMGEADGGPMDAHRIGMVNNDIDGHMMDMAQIGMMDGLRISTTHPADGQINIASATVDTPTTALTLSTVADHTTADYSMRRLVNIIESGFPNSPEEMPVELRSYHRFRDHMSSSDGLCLYKNRVVIPAALRPEALRFLHAAHQGQSSMISRAEQCIFWPGITQSIKEVRDSCMKCHKTSPSNPDLPPHPPTVPVYPFQRICCDYFSYRGIPYLIIVDRYSGWPVVKKAKDGATGLVNTLKEVIDTFGVPEELSSDGGPEFSSSTTKKALKQWGTHHRISSVANARSNGRAEVAVKSMKRLLMDNTGPNGNLHTDDFLAAILQYRNTPDTATGISPAMYTFHRPLRDFLPDINIGRRSNWEEITTQHQEAREQHITKHQARLHEHTRYLPPLQVGTKVFVQNQIGNSPTKWDLTGVVAEVRQFDQYVITLDHSGRDSVRNRKYLKACNMLDSIPYGTQMPTQMLVHSPEKQPITQEPSERTLLTTEPSIQLDTDITPAPQPAPMEEITHMEEQAIRPQRVRKPPDRLNYKELGNPN